MTPVRQLAAQPGQPAKQQSPGAIHNRAARPGLMNFLRHVLTIMTPGDRILFFVLLGMSILSILIGRAQLTPGQTASVFVTHQAVHRLPLASDRKYSISGRLGPMELGISHGAIRVLHSRCAERMCIRQGAISRRGQLIVCVPNQMVVTIDGEAEQSLDAVTP